MKSYIVFLLYFNTLRYLRLRQVIARLSKKFKYCLPFRSKKVNKLNLNSFVPYQPRTYQTVHDSEFTLLNEKKHVNLDLWNCEASYLWLYNMHYFDYIHKLDIDDALGLIKTWIHNHTSGVGWEPYPISLRLVNWFKFINKHRINDDVITASICTQSQMLINNIEYHLLGNHLLSNAKALIFIGIFLDGDIGSKALKKGSKILNSELSEQFLKDGAHFELSPMYNCIMLFDLLDIYNLLTSSGDLCLLKNKVKSILNEEQFLKWERAQKHSKKRKKKNLMRN